MFYPKKTRLVRDNRYVKKIMENKGTGTLSVAAFAILSLFSSPAMANCIVTNEALIKDKTAEKIEEMCLELQEKTGVIYRVSALRTLPDQSTIIDYEKKLAEGFTGPYVIMAVSSGDKKVDLLVSDDMKSVIDEDLILDDYVIPILKKKGDDNGEDTKFSAAVFNGSVKIMDDIAKNKSVKMTSVPMEAGDAKKSDFWNNTLRMLPVLLFIIVTVYFLLKYRKQNKG